MKSLINQRHPFHLVDPSPWPFFAASGALCTTFGFVMYMHGYYYGGYLATLGLALVIYTMFVWWRDVIREATFEGRHTQPVQQGLKYGMILFISSEASLFLAFFWGFFHASLAPSIEIGMVWPPYGLEVISAWGIPLLNTLILLTSGATLTWAHHALREGNHKETSLGLVLTIALAIFFTALQIFEYINAPFSINDGVYGSIFFMATGFHGFHVLIGTLFIIVCLLRHLKFHFTKQHHLGFEFAAWYWHFVDVVWLFLFVCVYWWGNYTPEIVS